MIYYWITSSYDKYELLTLHEVTLAIVLELIRVAWSKWLLTLFLCQHS